MTTATATITLTDRRAEHVVALIRQRPGVSRHRMALAILDIGLDEIKKDPKRLDAALIALVAEADRKTLHKREAKGSGK